MPKDKKPRIAGIVIIYRGMYILAAAAHVGVVKESGM
jgi:hypothetical protein